MNISIWDTPLRQFIRGRALSHSASFFVPEGWRVRLIAPAKVNLGLIVGGKRSDGFHEIETYMAKVELCDCLEVSVEPAETLTVSISGNDYVPKGADLMEKAASCFSSYWKVPFSLSVRIEKRIPLQAGLGGGSSDAASVLKALSSFFSLPVPAGLSSAVGSDVPFFVSEANCALVTGRGEQVDPCQGLSGQELCILVPESRVSTATAFKALDTIARPARHLPALGDGDLSREDYPNDFELIYTGVVPDAVSGPDYCSLTGSGSGWFIIPRCSTECLFTNSADFEIHKTRFM